MTGLRPDHTRVFTNVEDVKICDRLRDAGGQVSLNALAKQLAPELQRSVSSVRNRIYILLGRVPSRAGKGHRKLLESVLERALPF